MVTASGGVPGVDRGRVVGMVAVFALAAGCTTLLGVDGDYEAHGGSTSGEASTVASGAVTTGSGGGSGGGSGDGGGGGGGGGAGPTEECGSPAGEGGCGPAVNLEADPENCGACGHSCLPGACSEGRCQAFPLASAGTDVVALAVDASHVYFSDFDRIHRAPKQGGDVQEVTTTAGLARDLAVDGTQLVWGDAEGVHRVAAGVPDSDRILVETPLGASGVHVAPTGIFWVGPSSGSEAGRIEGDDVTPLGPSPVGVDIVTDATRAFWIALADGSGGFVGRAYLDGTAFVHVAETEPTAASMVLVDEHLYVPHGGGVGRVPTSAVVGPIEAFATSPDVVRHLAVDCGHLYWSFGSGAGAGIARASVDGGETEILAVDVAASGALVVDATTVYFAAGGGVSALRKPPR